MTRLRKLYEKYYGNIPDNYEIHHIIPKHSGGTDDVTNLVALSPEEHSKAHLKRYEELGDFRDLCSYYMIGYNFSIAHKISSSEGGKIGGKIVFERKIGIFRSIEERKIWAAAAGKISAQKQMDKKIGIHAQTKEERLIFASMGGKASGKFKDKIFQSEMGKRGGAKNKGFIWINDGKKAFKYTMKMQQNMHIEDYLSLNINIKKGRLLCQN